MKTSIELRPEFWAREQPIFNDYYKYNDRCGCMFCPLQSMVNSAYLLKYYPSEYASMVDMAKRTETDTYNKTGKRLSVWQGNSKYDTEYRDKLVREKYLPKLNKGGATNV